MFSPRLLVHVGAAGILCAALFWAPLILSSDEDDVVSSVSVADYGLTEPLQERLHHRSLSIDYTVRPQRAARVRMSEHRQAELEARNLAARRALRVLEQSLDGTQTRRCQPYRPDAMNMARDLVGDSIEEARGEVH